jgi:hypothetical protein
LGLLLADVALQGSPPLLQLLLLLRCPVCMTLDLLLVLLLA